MVRNVPVILRNMLFASLVPILKWLSECLDDAPTLKDGNSFGGISLSEWAAQCCQ